MAVLVGVLSLWLTWPETTADAPEYARDIVSARTHGAAVLAEPGHLAWRPLGYAIMETLGLPPDVPVVEQIRITQRRMTTLAEATGVIASIALAILTWQLSRRVLPTLLAPLLLVTSSTFISYAHAGTSYIAALACMTLGMVVGWQSDRPASAARGALSGGLVALAVLFWLPFVLVVPAALLGGFMVRRRENAPGVLSESIVALVVCAAVGIGTFTLVASALGIKSPHEFMSWIGGASHGMTTGGLSRVIIGLPRSFIYMGNDGREVKRYLLGDPLNPVTRSDLLTLGLWPKLLVFYAAGAAVLLLAVRDRTIRRGVVLLVVAAIPVLTLAVAWMGGDLERYLAIYPFALPVLTMAFSLVWERRQPIAALFIFIMLGVSWLPNLWTLGPVPARQLSRDMQARFGCLSDSLDARTLVVAPHHGDPLYLFARNRLDEVPRRTGAQVVTFVRSAAPGMDRWAQTMRDQLDEQLRTGGRVYVPDYVRDSVPPREMGWVEGVDRRVVWADIRRAWAAYQLREECNGHSRMLRVLADTAGRS